MFTINIKFASKKIIYFVKLQLNKSYTIIYNEIYVTVHRAKESKRFCSILGLF